MNRMKKMVLVLLMSLGAIGAQAQLEQAVKKIFAGDTIAETHPALKRDSDSAYVANCKRHWKKPGSMKRICVWRWSK